MTAADTTVPLADQIIHRGGLALGLLWFAIVHVYWAYTLPYSASIRFGIGTGLGFMWFVFMWPYLDVPYGEVNGGGA